MSDLMENLCLRIWLNKTVAVEVTIIIRTRPIWTRGSWATEITTLVTISVISSGLKYWTCANMFFKISVASWMLLLASELSSELANCFSLFISYMVNWSWTLKLDCCSPVSSLLKILIRKFNLSWFKRLNAFKLDTSRSSSSSRECTNLR